MPGSIPGAGVLAVIKKEQTHKKQITFLHGTYILVVTHPDLRKHDHLTYGREPYVISKTAQESNCMTKIVWQTVKPILAHRGLLFD